LPKSHQHLEETQGKVLAWPERQRVLQEELSSELLREMLVKVRRSVPQRA
jgi:hypothetical protein